MPRHARRIDAATQIIEDRGVQMASARRDRDHCDHQTGFESNYEAACRLWSDWCRSYCSQSPAAVLLRRMILRHPNPCDRKPSECNSGGSNSREGVRTDPPEPCHGAATGTERATMSSTQSDCQKHLIFNGPRLRRQTSGRNGRIFSPGYNRKKRRSRRAARIPPIVPQPPASSCSLLNLAGSAKVALGWARSIAR